MLVQACGVESMLPPVTTDCKLFLLTAHLCCVEVRMLLEAEDIDQVVINPVLFQLTLHKATKDTYYFAVN